MAKGRLILLNIKSIKSVHPHVLEIRILLPLRKKSLDFFSCFTKCGPRGDPFSYLWKKVDI